MNEVNIDGKLPLIFIDNAVVFPKLSKQITLSNKNQIKALEKSYKDQNRFIIIAPIATSVLGKKLVINKDNIVATLARINFIIDEDSDRYHFECYGLSRIVINNFNFESGYYLSKFAKVKTIVKQSKAELDAIKKTVYKILY